MESDIQKAVEAGKLTAAAGRALSHLPPGTYVQHKSWGFGQIESFDFLIGQVVIHFKTKRGHTMQLQYAADSLAPLAAGHILTKKATDLAAVKAQVKGDAVNLVRSVLESHGGKATQEQIAAALVPDVLSEAEFKRWIEATKKALKNDGHFAIPTKKGLPFELRDGPISHADEYIAAFNNARQLKHQIAALDLIVKNLGEFTAGAAQLQPVVVAADDTCKKSARLHPAEALTLLLGRDELLARAPGLQRAADAPTVAAVLRESERSLPTLLAEVPASKMKRAIGELPGAFGDGWLEVAIKLVLRGNTKIVGEAARLITEQGRTAELRTALERAISEHSISTESLNWLCRERSGPLSELVNARLLNAIVAALERDQFSEKRDRKLHDLLMSDQELLTDLISDASLEDLRDTMRKLLLTPVFEELNKRSLLGRIIRVYPELESMVSGGPEQKQEALVVSWESLEKRKAEFDELVMKKIPENTKEISIARSYGDLRENFEFKAAKEMQRVLMRRKAETERELSLARGTDFANPDTSAVSIGTIVTLKETADGRIDVYTILGAWDGDPEKGIVSYQSALAQALIGRKVGDSLSVPTEHGERQVEIVSIAPYRK
jgi:transcription elongation GreA/GreB family factor/transcription elongation factor GreA-like protein